MTDREFDTRVAANTPPETLEALAAVKRDLSIAPIGITDDGFVEWEAAVNGFRVAHGSADVIIAYARMRNRYLASRKG